MPDNTSTTSSEFFRQLVNSLEGYAILSFDKKGFITSWNLSAQKMFGYKNSEILGKKIFILFTSDYVKSGKFEKKLKRAIKDGSAEDEKWFLRKDGQTFWGRGKIYVLKDRQ